MNVRLITIIIEKQESLRSRSRKMSRKNCEINKLEILDYTNVYYDVCSISLIWFRQASLITLIKVEYL